MFSMISQEVHLQQIEKTATNFFIAICILVFLVGMVHRFDLSFWGLNANFFCGWFYQILTTHFFHAGVLHLAFNMAISYHFGHQIEKILLGTRQMFIFYGMAIVLTGLLNVAVIRIFFWDVGGFGMNLIGFSGVLSALLGFWWFFTRDKQAMAILILGTLFPLLLSLSVAWWAHLSGFVVGVCLAILAQRIKRIR